LKKQKENTSQNKKTEVKQSTMHSYPRVCTLQFPEKEESPLNNGRKYNMETPQLHNVDNSIIETGNAIKLLYKGIQGSGGIAPPFFR
jgi:hypothetical protein